MIKKMKKEPKVAVCRRCGGHGHILGTDGQQQICPQCEGSGRCVVSCEMLVNIEPYSPAANVVGLVDGTVGIKK